MTPPPSFNDSLDDSLTMSQPRKRRSVSLDFLIWKRKAKSIIDPDELSALMHAYYMDQASQIEDPIAKALTMMSLTWIDFDALAYELIETTNYEQETKN
jgi:hypothetical protein